MMNSNSLFWFVILIIIIYFAREVFACRFVRANAFLSFPQERVDLLDVTSTS